MPFQKGPTELIIILFIVLIVFGVGRLGEVGGALGKGIKEFRKAQHEEEDTTPPKEESREQKT